jgi:hypothetical protein
MTTMFIYEGNDGNIPTDTEAYYEAVASQEEIYLEETEEELRAILVFHDSSPSKQQMTDATNNPRAIESIDEQEEHAAKELITGDSDDPPLNDEAIVKMLDQLKS